MVKFQCALCKKKERVVLDRISIRKHLMEVHKYPRRLQDKMIKVND